MKKEPLNPLFPTPNVVDSFAAQVELHPDKIAIVYPEVPGVIGGYKNITFHQLWESVGRLCNGLADLGIKKGDRVVLMIPMSLIHYQLLLALFKMGAVAVYIDPGMGLKAIEAAASICEPEAYVGILKAQVLRLFSPSCRAIPLQIGLDCPPFLVSHDLRKIMTHPKTEYPTANVTCEDRALITFTSGTTGTPKGADRTHGFLLAQNRALLSEAHMFTSDVYMPGFPIVLLLNLSWGITSLIPNMNSARPGGVHPPLIVDQIRQCANNLASGSPAYVRRLTAYCLQEGITLPEIERFWTGGAPVSIQVVRDLQKILPRGDAVVIYGSTECEPISHIDAKIALAPDLLKASRRGRGNCVGPPAGCVELKIIRLSDEPIELGDRPLSDFEQPRGEPGEIVVTGDHVNKKYFKNPEAEKETKIQEITASGQKTWHRTGDVGTLDEQGRIWLLGRVSTRVRTAGRTLFTIEVENVLCTHPLVENCALLGGVLNQACSQSAYLAVQLKSPHLWKLPWRRNSYRRSLLRFIREKGFPIRDLFWVFSLPFDRRHNAKIEYPILREKFKQILK